MTRALTMESMCVPGYHVYHKVWEAAIGEVLACEKEPRNAKDRYTVAVKCLITFLSFLLEVVQESHLAK